MKKHKRKYYLISIIIGFLILFTSFFNIYENNESDLSELLKVHVIDVGQGDSIFIELGNDKTMLIDAGEREKGEVVKSYINNLGYEKINYLVATHPHADHIGAMYYIVDNFEIENIYMPKAITNTKTYENLLQTISSHNLKINTAKVGVNIYNGSNLQMDIIAPNSSSYTSLNDYSAVIKLVYGNTCFLFMGDAEVKSEQEITSDINCDVVKIGHHGSNTSSSEDFIKKVNAKYAVISVGKDNKYNHPSDLVLNRWQNAGTIIYRTDISGNIIFKSNGNSISVETER